jgi:glycosyltransferase involved in cell wall biosynthesis
VAEVAERDGLPRRAPRRLALIGPSAPLRGGIAQYHDRLAAALAARGHAVTRISFRRMYPGLLFPGRTQYEASAASAPPRAGGDALAPPAALLDSIGPRSWWRVAALAARSDVALFEWWHPFFAPALACIATRLRRRGVPTIVLCHNLEPHEPMPGGALLARLALGRAAGFIVQSSADAARLRARYPGRPVTLMLHPAEAPAACAHAGTAEAGARRAACAATFGAPPAARRILFFGYVRAYKGLPTLIEAMPLLPADVQLVVAGEIYHHDAGHYRTLAGRLGVGDRVVLLDRFVASKDLACCFGMADLVVLPYWSASQSGVAPLAFVSGRAVVASAVGGLPDLIRPGETGLLVPPRDAPALAAAVAQALEHAAQWGTAAAAAARGFSWDAAAAAVEELASAVSAPRPAC